MAAGVPPSGRSRCQGRAVVVVRLDVYNGALATCLLVAETAVSVAREGTGEGGAENTQGLKMGGVWVGLNSQV